MATFFFITCLSGILTFISAVLLTTKYTKNVLAKPIKIGMYKIHHSVYGVILVVLGIIILKSPDNPISAFGLGMYLSHIAEEMYLNKTKLIPAIFVFVTLITYKNSK